MRLIIDTVRDELRSSHHAQLEYGRLYSMPDHPDHRFIVRQMSDSLLLIQIKKGKQVVQRGEVRHLSATVGRSTSGDPLLQAYEIELDPEREIYPIAELVKRVLATGVEYWQISPMFEDRSLSDCVANHSSPHMVSDGKVERIEHPAGRGLLSSSQFRVQDATWAVLFFGTEINHVYLWMGAANNAETVLDALKRIEAGDATPVYGA